MKRPRLIALVTALVCVMVTPVASSHVAGAQGQSCPDPGTKAPVLFVHGWHGHANDLGPLRSGIEAIGGVTVDTTFSYPNTHWVTSSDVGPALAQRIVCLADKSRVAGGVGQVVVVAHSMGGLAVRCASDPICAKTDIGDRLGLVVTLGTPNLGTPLADYAAASRPGSDISTGLPRAVLNATNGLCHLISPTAADLGVCDWFLSSDPGLQGLRPASSQLASLPPLRAGVPRVAIGGHITVTSRLFFGPTFTLADLGSDGVVGVNSAHADAQTGRPPPSRNPESACELAIRIALPEANSDNPVADTIANTLLGGLPSCSHSHLPADPTTQQLAVNAIRSWLQAKAPVVPVVACPTTAVVPNPTPLPATALVNAPLAGLPPMALYAAENASSGVLAPKDWSCSAFVGGDGNTSIRVWPPNESPPETTKTGDGVFAFLIPGCVGCMYDLACALFPPVEVAPYAVAGGGSCPTTVPPQERDTPINANVVAFEDPPGVAGTGEFSGGKDPANGVVIFNNPNMPRPDYGAAEGTCILPNSQQSICRAVLNDFSVRYATGTK